MTIIFRSLRATHTRTGNSGQTIRAHWSDWSHLRWYTDTDDARDIVWGKSTDTTHTYIKERQDTGNFHIIFAQESQEWDDFSSPTFPVSRHEFQEQNKKIIKYNAYIGGHSYGEYTDIEKLVWEKPRNHLILVFSGTLQREDIEHLWMIARHNDLVFFHVFHPYEIHPEEEILFLWKTINQGKYKLSFEESRKNIEKYIYRIEWSYVQLNTTENIEERLNYFFKNRFKHG